MSESAKYIWCQHCYTGWIAKEDKPYYPKCWSCGIGASVRDAHVVERGGRLGCLVATDVPSPGGWVLPTSRLGATSKSPDDQLNTEQLWHSCGVCRATWEHPSS